MLEASAGASAATEASAASTEASTEAPESAAASAAKAAGAARSAAAQNRVDEDTAEHGATHSIEGATLLAAAEAAASEVVDIALCNPGGFLRQADRPLSGGQSSCRLVLGLC